MDSVVARLPHVVYIVVPLLFFMAWIYLALHVVFARFIGDPTSPVLWFFAIVTGPLTRPVRALLPRATPEPRVRLVSLGVYFALWVVARVVLAGLMGPARV
jgi:hypothetical protein